MIESYYDEKWRCAMKTVKRIMMGALALCLALSFGCTGFVPPMYSGGSSSSLISSEIVSSSEASTGESSEEGLADSSEESAVESSEESSIESSEESVSSSEEHTHVFAEPWRKTASYHWLQCECGERTEKAKHTGEAPSCTENPHCEVCGMEFGKPAPHSYGEMVDIGEGVMGFACGGCEKKIPLMSGEKDGEFVEGVVDFAVEVEEGKDPVVLQLSDPQLCDWGSLETNCFAYIRETVAATNPDLIIITGDIVYGKFDEKGKLLLDFIEFMDSLGIYWAPVFGNHDNECLLGVDWQCEQLENAEYCLFEQRNLMGNGNYNVAIVQGDKILRVFYMMDSNGCSNPMIDRNDQPAENVAGQNAVKTSAGFDNFQVEWYTESITTLKTIAPDVKISFAFHIQIAAFLEAFQKYEAYDGVLRPGSSSALMCPVNLDRLAAAEEGDFGYIGRRMKGAWDTTNRIFSGLKELGVDSIFVGHEHCNSASIVLDGIRFQYGQKSSTYDRYNVLKENGGITDNENGTGVPLIGGSVIPLSQEDGSIVGPYIYLCGNPLGLNP